VTVSIRKFWNNCARFESNRILK